MKGVAAARLLYAIYGVSGCAGLIYETVWIRQFSISFGNTLLSFSTVTAIFLGGLALGAFLGGRFPSRRPAALYAAAEIWTGCYALAIPFLMRASGPVLAAVYGPESSGAALLPVTRALLCAAILLPGTVPMGAALPWMAAWLQTRLPTPAAGVSWLYAVNTVGGAAGALLAGFTLLPAMGYQATLKAGSCAGIAAGLGALYLARGSRPDRGSEDSGQKHTRGPEKLLLAAAALAGSAVMLYEVVWSRAAGLLFGPTSLTVTLSLALTILGLAAGSLFASAIRQNVRGWLAGSQFAAAAILLLATLAVSLSPAWLADQIRAHSESPLQSGTLEALCLAGLLLPLMTALGMALPLTIRLAGDGTTTRALGELYGANTAGCIAGCIAAGWLLIPHIGTERSLYIGAVVNACIGVAVLGRSGRIFRFAGPAIAIAALALLVFPQWDMTALTAGAYKYAPYYTGRPDAELHKGEVLFLREGTAGTVTVRRVGGALALAIDGKVDATDSGGDLLTEKLLAHLPLGMIEKPRHVCVIGLASGVTAGAALAYPVERLDILEVSPEVVRASHFFDSINGRPLESARAKLLVNDGRNHLELTGTLYDAILSEPSNPWISGMNSMFTRDFFRIAKRRLQPGGVLAQWFHVYNMPPGDLKSLLRAFTDVFPSAALWQLNEGDVLLTGFADALSGSSPMDPWRMITPAEAMRDLASVGAAGQDLLASLYVMRGADLARFAAGAESNTDDRPLLEFHGLQHLHAQTDEENMRQLSAFATRVAAPPAVRDAWAHFDSDSWARRGAMFEKAESLRLAFESYRTAIKSRPDFPDALAGMIRTARTSAEREQAGTLESLTAQALDSAKNGQQGKAEAILTALTGAYANQPEPWFNYGLFCMERGRYKDAEASFNAAIQADPRYLPAFEAMAETAIRKGDRTQAKAWSRRILQIDPTHAVALQTVANADKAR